MAHLLRPAGITYPESERFRNYLVRPPASQQKERTMVICCERPVIGRNECRADVRCRILDGDTPVSIKLGPNCSDVVTGFCEVNDCRPRPPLTQPGLLCHTERVERYGCKLIFAQVNPIRKQ
ncbi:hypothetical protein ElyMa_003335100 [Elysia marginata]|uniref:SUEL-type lectin domain-containing protein n=1 Tax=Elysia marginata TaxID=1093978 RepID=A0AAV4JGV3_9GAST|nr:hypothetical protein ElyMa_003335100 [Elysia marginata]